MLWEQNPHRGWFENIISDENFLDWQKQNQVFAGMAAFRSNSFRREKRSCRNSWFLYQTEAKQYSSGPLH